jgi:hypothetical protein
VELRAAQALQLRLHDLLLFLHGSRLTQLTERLMFCELGHSHLHLLTPNRGQSLHRFQTSRSSTMDHVSCSFIEKFDLKGCSYVEISVTVLGNVRIRQVRNLRGHFTTDRVPLDPVCSAALLPRTDWLAVTCQVIYKYHTKYYTTGATWLAVYANSVRVVAPSELACTACSAPLVPRTPSKQSQPPRL